MKARLKRSEAIYLTCYSAFIVAAYIFGEIFNKPRAMWLICPFIAIGAFIATILKNRQTIKGIMLRLAIIVIFGIASVVSRKPQVLVCAAMICGADTTSFRRICRCSVYTCVSIVFIAFVLNTIGLLPDGNWSRFGVQIKTFGFGYYSIVPYTFLYMVLIYLYMKYEKEKRASWIELIIILVLNYILYRFTTLRLTYYLVYLTILLYVLLIKFGWFDLRNKVLNFLTVLIFPLLFALSVWTNYAFTFSNPVFFQANRLLTRRLELGHEALQRYPINFLGHYIETNNSEIPSEYFYIDSGFLFSLLGYGLLFTGVLLIIYVYMHNYSARVNDKMLFIWLTVVAVFSFTNNTWIAIQYNPIVLMFPIILKELRMSPLRVWLSRRKARTGRWRLYGNG